MHDGSNIVKMCGLRKTTQVLYLFPGSWYVLCVGSSFRDFSRNPSPLHLCCDRTMCSELSVVCSRKKDSRREEHGRVRKLDNLLCDVHSFRSSVSRRPGAFKTLVTKSVFKTSSFIRSISNHIMSYANRSQLVGRTWRRIARKRFLSISPINPRDFVIVYSLRRLADVRDDVFRVHNITIIIVHNSVT